MQSNTLEETGGEAKPATNPNNIQRYLIYFSIMLLLLGISNIGHYQMNPAAWMRNLSFKALIFIGYLPIVIALTGITLGLIKHFMYTSPLKKACQYQKNDLNQARHFQIWSVTRVYETLNFALSIMMVSLAGISTCLMSCFFPIGQSPASWLSLFPYILFPLSIVLLLFYLRHYALSIGSCDARDDIDSNPKPFKWNLDP